MVCYRLICALFLGQFAVTNAGVGLLGFYPPLGRANRVEDINVRFYNGNSIAEYVDVPLYQAELILNTNGFDKSNPTVLYISGYIETAKQESGQAIASAYLQARPSTNFLLLDWTNMAHGSYLLNAAPNSKLVGLAVAEQFQKLMEAGLAADRLHLIGFSLGSQVAGYVARQLKYKYNRNVKRLTALDPAFPGFYPGLVLEHVSEKDAEFVDVIHTHAGGYGAPVPTGTVDFWPNGGIGIQPGCPIFAPIPLSDNNLCSHWRSWQFFAESVRNPTAFPASPAGSYLQFNTNPTPQLGMVYMGVDCDPGARGSFYLTTNTQSPFGRGLQGIRIY